MHTINLINTLQYPMIINRASERERERERERRARERMVFRQSESGSDKNSIALRSHYQSHNTPKYFSKSSRRKNPEFLFFAVGARVLNLRPASWFSFSRFLFLLLYAHASGRRERSRVSAEPTFPPSSRGDLFLFFRSRYSWKRRLRARRERGE